MNPFHICSTLDKPTGSIEVRAARTPLIRQLREGLNGSTASRPGVPTATGKGVSEGAAAGARCALKCGQIRSLAAAFGHIPDHRGSKSRRHPKSAMFTLIVHGLLCGGAGRQTRSINEQQRKAIGLIPARQVRAPGPARIRRAQRLAGGESLWLIKNAGPFPE